MKDDNGNIIKTIGKMQGALSEQKNRFSAEQAKRESAPRILTPDDFNKKRWTVKETLQTTLNGELLPITKADLKVMAQNIKALEDAHQYAGGITANEIISMSRSADIKRAKAEIHQAVPLQIKGGRIHFVTNAGPDSDLTRHHVIVLLENYEKGMATGTPLQAAKRAAQGSIKFDCDCGRHTFWYRYITTILKVNAGRAELGFPKIRNPYLTGIACKHTLRVMTELNSSLFIHKRIADALAKDRKNLADKTNKKQQANVKLTQKQANDLAKKQDKSQRKVGAIEKKAIQQAMATAKPAKKAANNTKRTAPNPALPDPYIVQRTQLKSLGQTDKQIDDMIAKETEQYRSMGKSDKQIEAMIKASIDNQ